MISLRHGIASTYAHRRKQGFDRFRQETSPGEPMQAWRKIIESRPFANFAVLKSIFNATDRVGDYYVFNIGGNKYRIIAAIHFNRQLLFIREVLTHKEYDAWKP